MKLSEIKNELRAFILERMPTLTEENFAYEEESWSLEPEELKIRESFIGSDDIDITDEAFERIISLEYAVFQTNDGSNRVDDIIFDFAELFKFNGSELCINDNVYLIPAKTSISSIKDGPYRGRSFLIFFRLFIDNK